LGCSLHDEKIKHTGYSATFHVDLFVLHIVLRMAILMPRLWNRR